ncbi:hypothetical protein GCM10009789_37700 [Kribbella sancticallisti]|uniref:Uncharacterized protein n=1 Tax=Kribbella sancticallisti TaxID=460087 RepID=A0ABP4PJZ7_9ACTN
MLTNASAGFCTTVLCPATHVGELYDALQALALRLQCDRALVEPDDTLAWSASSAISANTDILRARTLTSPPPAAMSKDFSVLCLRGAAGALV